jgi:formamidopyrimidine-DNA glycosylase
MQARPQGKSMPELPEVAHIVSHLAPRIVGRKIGRVVLADPGLARGAESIEAAVGARIVEVRRRAKLIIIDLGRRALVFHLKLTGKLWVKSAREARSPFTRLALDLGRGEELRLEDMRRLGWYRVVGPEDLRAIEDAHGPEPLEPGYTFDAFEGRRRKRRGAVKPVLLDPKFVSGIGNIYADEILFEARIHPLEPIQGISPARARKLHATIVSVLASAVAARRGEPDQERVGSGSRTASKRHALAVFQRTGEPCPRCAAKILRIVVRGRGTHLCPTCQNAPPESR